MRRLPRTAARWFAGAVAALLLVLCIPITAVALPYPFFGHRTLQGSVALYSDGELGEGLAVVLADVNRRLECAEVLPAGKVNRVFLCQSRSLYEMFARLSLVNPNVQGFNLSVFGNTFVSLPQVERARAANCGVPRYSPREGSLAHVIAHEIAHDLTQNAVGFLRYRRLPVWKREGYAEYGAIIAAVREDPGAGLKDRVSILLDDGSWPQGHGGARMYYRAELMVEYLVEVEGYGFEDIMHEGVTFEGAYSGLMGWYGRSNGK
jgi:hypothetical protein